MNDNDFLLDNIDFLFQETEKIENLLKKYLEKIAFITKSSFSALYLSNDPENIEKKLKLFLKIGNYNAPNFILCKDKLYFFLNESREYVVLTERKESPFSSILLNDDMRAGAAIPVFNKDFFNAVIILNFVSSQMLNNSVIIQIEKFKKIICLMEEYYKFKK